MSLLTTDAMLDQLYGPSGVMGYSDAPSLDSRSSATSSRRQRKHDLATQHQGEYDPVAEGYKEDLPELYDTFHSLQNQGNTEKADFWYSTFIKPRENYLEDPFSGGFAPKSGLYSPELQERIRNRESFENLGPDVGTVEQNPYATLQYDFYIGEDGRPHSIHPSHHTAVDAFAAENPQGLINSFFHLDMPNGSTREAGAGNNIKPFVQIQPGQFTVTKEMIDSGQMPFYTGISPIGEPQKGYQRYGVNTEIRSVPGASTATSGTSSGPSFTQSQAAQLLLNQGADPYGPAVTSLLGIKPTGAPGMYIDTSGNTWWYNGTEWVNNGGGQSSNGIGINRTPGGGVQTSATVNSGGTPNSGTFNAGNGGQTPVTGGGMPPENTWSGGGTLPPYVPIPPGYGGAGSGYGLEGLLSNVANALRDISVNTFTPEDRKELEEQLKARWQRETDREIQNQINGLANVGMLNSSVAGSVLSDVTGRRRDAYTNLLQYLSELSESRRKTDLNTLLGAGNLGLGMTALVPNYLAQMYNLEAIAPWQAGQAQENYYNLYSQNTWPENWSI